MLKIKLSRTGAKNKPSFRIVVTEKRSKRDGRPVEELGYYNARTSPPTLKVDAERVEHWLEHGAQPTPTVQRLLHRLENQAQGTALKTGLESPAPSRGGEAPAPEAETAAPPTPEAAEPAAVVETPPPTAEEEPSLETAKSS